MDPFHLPDKGAIPFRWRTSGLLGRRKESQWAKQGMAALVEWGGVSTQSGMAGEAKGSRKRWSPFQVWKVRGPGAEVPGSGTKDRTGQKVPSGNRQAVFP